jgi:ATP/maltotriose-dependent transcriptional regulator MalT
MPRYQELRRPRLDALLSSADKYTLVVIQAPAGFGKSVLLRQWREACGSASVFVEETSRCLNSNKGVSQGLNCLKQIVRDHAEQILVFDDADELFSNEETGRWLVDLIEGRMRRSAIILASRKRLAVPLSKLRLQGRVLEIGRDELRFSSVEIKEHLPELDGDQLKQTADDTRGWPVAIQALKMSQAEREPADRLSGREKWLADYYREEVLSPLGPELIRFVRQTCIFKQFSAALCDYCFEQLGSAALIRQVEDAGIFLEALSKDRKWFAYEPLFSEFARYLLEEQPLAEAAGYHDRAAAWLEANDLIEDAFEHALACDQSRAAELLDRHAIQLSRTGRMRVVMALADRLPKSIVSAYPTLLLTMAQFSSIAWRTPEAEQLLSLLAGKRHMVGDDDRVQFMIRDQRMQVAFYEDDMPRTETLCRELLRDPSGADDAFIGHVCGSLLYAQREQFKFSETARLTETALRHFDKANEFYALIWHHTKVAPGLALTGDLGSAIEEAEKGYEVALRYTRRYPHLASAPALLLAGMKYERNEIEVATKLIDEYLPQSRGGLIDQLSAGYVTRSKIHQLRNEYERAYDITSVGLKVASERGLDRLKQHLLEELFRLLLETGEIAKLKRLALAEGFSAAWSEFLPTAASTTRDERRAMAWLHAHSFSQVDGAILLAKRWRDRLARAGARGARLSWDLALCRLHLAKGDEGDAVKMLRAGLEIAAAGRYIRRIMDEHSSVKQLIVAQNASSRIKVTSADRFVEDLSRLMIGTRPDLLLPPETSGGETVTRKLSQKELDILFMAGSGLSNREIAGKFGLTEGSVKWYLQQIYNKIGTRRRAALIGRARLLGLMPNK